MTRPDAIITLCKEYAREPTRRSWLAVSKAFLAIGLTQPEIVELETRMGFRQANGELYPEIATAPARRKKYKLNWTNVR